MKNGDFYVHLHFLYSWFVKKTTLLFKKSLPSVAAI